MQAAACEAGLTLDQFWEMTPREFSFYLEGYRRRQRAEDWRMATLAAYIVNVANAFGDSSRTVQPWEILGYPMSPSDMKALEKRRRQHDV